MARFFYQQIFIFTLIILTALALTACGNQDENRGLAGDDDGQLEVVNGGHDHDGSCFHSDDAAEGEAIETYRFQKEADMNLVTPDNNDFGFSFEVSWQNVSTSWRKALEKSIADINVMVKDPDFYNTLRNVSAYSCIAGSTGDRTGTENSLAVADYIANAHVKVKLKTYYAWSQAKGKTGGNTISFNRRYSGRGHAALTSTLFHELLHVSGFGHCGKNNPRKYSILRTSVPYTAGSIVENYVTNINKK